MAKTKKKLTPLQLLDFFEMFCMLVESGSSPFFLHTIADGIEEGEFLDLLVIYNNERRMGTPDGEAICALANRINNEYFHRFTRFLLFAKMTGGHLVPSIRGLIQELRSVLKFRQIKLPTLVLPNIEVSEKEPPLLKRESRDLINPFLSVARQVGLSVIITGVDSLERNSLIDFFNENKSYQVLDLSKADLFESLFYQVTNEKPIVALLPGVNIRSAINGLYLIGKKVGLDRRLLNDAIAASFVLIITIEKVGQSYVKTSVKECLGIINEDLNFQDIFILNHHGFDSEANAITSYSSTGYIPSLVCMLEARGIQSAHELFI